jgi:transposase-like protein
MSRADFLEMFPTDDACLEYLKNQSYPAGQPCPRCGRRSKFHRITGRSAYSCQFCGTHVYPTAGTIFHRSTTSLQLWFWAVYLVSYTRGEITPRELERELGVTYRTARRMAERIRTVLGVTDEKDPPTIAPGEADEEQHKPAQQSIWNARRRAG